MAPQRRRTVPQLLTLTIATAILPAAEAVIVSPGSPCEMSCGNTLEATAPEELVCRQEAYAEEGETFQGCIECQSMSGYYNDDTSDTQWMLYNLRYAVSYCLFGNPENDDLGNTPCATEEACGGFAESISSGNLTTDGETYDYCDTWPVEDLVHVDNCRNCLRSGNEYLANFFTVLQAGCEQRPANGIDIGFEGSMFSTQQVNITEPRFDADIDPSWFDQGPLNLGAKVGIAVGGFVALLMVTGCCIVWRGKRKRRAFLRTLEIKPHGRKAWPSSPPQGEMFETPVSQRPLRSWDDSPMSTHTDNTFPRYFSPYSSQYNSPVSAQDAPQQQQQWQDSAFGGAQNIGVALGGDDSGRNQNQHQWSHVPIDAKGKAKDDGSYEMHQVESAGGGSFRERQRQAQLQQQQQHDAPMLGHPGYGRTSDSPPRTYGLMDHGSNTPPNAF